jgi:hypothetical protein
MTRRWGGISTRMDGLIQLEYEWQDEKEENRFPGWDLRYRQDDYEDDRYYDYDSDSDDGRYY